jgi:hypothetical protein
MNQSLTSEVACTPFGPSALRRDRHDIVEVTMNEGLDDCIPRRNGFSVPVTVRHRIPLFREDFPFSPIVAPGLLLASRRSPTSPKAVE